MRDPSVSASTANGPNGARESLPVTGAATPGWAFTGASSRPEVEVPLFTRADTLPTPDGLVLWDMWPLARADGSTAEVAGGRLWFALSAPAGRDPDARHDVARIRLLHEVAGEWRDLGAALPQGRSPGAREWSGSAVLEPEGLVRLFLTAAGREGEPRATFEQRLFELEGRLVVRDGRPTVEGWRPAREVIAPDDDVYVDTRTAGVSPGVIKAWRDPAYFRDPADGAEHLMFAASLKRASGPYDGAIGHGRRTPGASWRLLPPLLHALGVNRELERPHAVFRDGRYYVFWSTQRRMFAPEVAGPTGLYGVVGETLRGPFRPLNGDGLVLANPESAPRLAYAWWVTGEGEVTGFADHLGPEPAAGTQDAAPRGDSGRFVGAPAPFLRLHFDDDRVTLA